MARTGFTKTEKGLGGSKLGRQPLKINSGVEVKVSERSIYIKGPKGELTTPLNDEVTVEMKDGSLLVSPKDPYAKSGKAFHGLYSRLAQNALIGVTEGFKRVLILVGTGYRAKVSGSQLEMSLGYSHPVVMDIPKGISCVVEENNTKVILEGIDKEALGQFAANIKKKRKPEPYKGKGIRYENEQIKKKAGKSGKAKG